MNYYTIQPEVGGSFGPNSVLNPTIRPPAVEKFNYEFDVWLGDPILEAISCFIVTEKLEGRIREIKATGASFSTVEISKSGIFEDLHPELQLPEFVWLQVNGQSGKDDFGLSSKHDLVVSERILEVLKAEGMRHATVSEFK